MNILMVDDDLPVNGGEEAQEFRNAGHQVMVARDGGPALALFREEASAGRRFDLVLSDVNMGRMNGDELHRQIKTELGTCQFVLMSACPSDEIKAYGKREGITVIRKRDLMEWARQNLTS